MKTVTTIFKNAFGIRLSSGDGDEYPGCKLFLTGGHKFITINLPQLISPKREKVYPKTWDNATIQRLGRDWYYDYTERVYGFTIFDSHLSILYGLQAMDSSIDQHWGFFIPWLEKRMVRYNVYYSDGTLFAELCADWSIKDGTYDKNRSIIDSMPKTQYQFKDFDGELINATCYIEEREWRQGTKWFKWVSLFCKPFVRRSLDLEFSSEVGRRKRSWKGGTLRHGAEIHKGEPIESAFKRYCLENNLTFIGEVPWVPKVKKVVEEPKIITNIKACL